MSDQENFEQNGTTPEAPKIPRGLPKKLPENLRQQQNVAPEPTKQNVEPDWEPAPQPEPQPGLSPQPEPEQPVVEQPKKKSKKELKQEQMKNNGKVVVKKKGGCGTFFAGFFFAIVFLIATIGGAGAYVYFCVNLQQVESLIGVKLPIDGDLNKKTIKDLIALGFEVKDSYVHMKIGEVETKIGINLPQKFPGTDIDITFLYDSNVKINYKGSQINLKDIEVMDAANNFDKLVDGVLEVVYDHVTVGQILQTADLEQTLIDMGWPAFKDEIYDVSGTKKKLSDLTINQAKDVLVDYYGAENLTVQKLIDATALVVIPNKPMYDTLRGLKVQKITTQDILDNVTGEILNDLLDLSDFEFTQTEEFNNTPLSGMIDYIQTLHLGDFITLENCVEDDFFTNHPMFESLKKTYVSKLDDGILNLKINQILTTTQLSRTSITTVQQTYTLEQLLTARMPETILTVFGAQNVGELGAYIEELKTTNYLNFKSQYNDLSWAEKLGLDGSSTALLDLSTLTLRDITESEDIPITIFEKLGTLGDLIGSTDNSIMKLISKIELKDLLTNAGTAITDALEYDENHDLVSLATMLDMTDDSGINGIISGITVKALLDTPDTAISNALKSSTSTLGELLSMSSTSTGINAIIKDITVGALFNTPDTAIKNALESSDTTIADLLGMTDTTGINGIVAGITVGALFGDSDNAIKDALESSTMTLAVLLGMTSSDGINGIVGSITVQQLFTNPDTAIKNALSSNTQTLKQFLGATTTPNTIADYVLTNLTVANLFDEDNVATTLTNKINDMPLRFVLGTQPPTGFLSLIDSNYYANATVGGIQSLMESVDIANITLGTLIDKQVIELDYAIFSDTTVLNHMRGLTLMDILEAYYNAVKNGQITP